jgi:RNA polymerase sigma-54 factor
MALEHRLELKLSQKLILTPQLQQAIKLLQLPQLELSQTLGQELIENPFLEESLEETAHESMTPEEREFSDTEEPPGDNEIPDAPLEGMDFSVEEYFEERGSDGRDLGYFNPGTVNTPSSDNFLSRTPDIYDHLFWQLRLSHEREDIRKTGEVVIGNIDENGYLRSSVEELMQEASADRDTIEKAIALIQTFDPSGVCARDITECLLLQVRHLNLHDTLVEKIIINNLDDLEKKKYHYIAQQHGAPQNDIMAAVKVIEGLDPKPGRSFSSTSTTYIVPDVYVIKTAEGYQIILNDEGLPKLRISSYYRNLVQQKNSMLKEDKQFMVEKLRSAIELLKSLDQRNKTIHMVTECILKLQQDFFEKGTSCMKPLTLKDIASMLDMHESTISRVTSNKYLSCSHGLFCFRHFFSSALRSNAGDVSSTSVKDLIRKIISEENSRKPLSDKLVVEILKEQGIFVARRTVAKYREELGIPSQLQRKKPD